MGLAIAWPQKGNFGGLTYDNSSQLFWVAAESLIP